ncbi:MAG: helix-turn-helix transcriptional regulator [Oscillospiraceae bacterium]|nr:helix-turn-helix transcriptional regulator [Oscillospiraceae bacterium]
MTINYKRIGNKIKIFRKSKHMSQADLAELTELSVPYISHIETGRKKASLETLVKIADVLNVTVDRLLCGNQEHNSKDYEPELRELISDCSIYEKSVIYDTAHSVKKSLRMNNELLFKKRG